MADWARTAAMITYNDHTRVLNESIKDGEVYN